MKKEHYTSRAQKTGEELSEVKRKIYLLGTIRLFLFLATTGFAVWLNSFSEPALWLTISAGILLFLFLLRINNRFQKRKAYLETSLECDQAEIRAFENDLSAFDGAPEMADPAHPYSFDLDLFGEHSLFQLLNRTCTDYGRNVLVSRFRETPTDPLKIGKRQEAAMELARKPALLHHFRVSGLIRKGDKRDYEEIREFAGAERLITPVRFWKIASRIIPLSWLIVAGFTISGALPYTVPVVWYIVTLAISEARAIKVNRLQQYVGKKVHILKNCSGLIRIIEGERFESEKLQELQRGFSSGENASRAISRLARLAGELEQRSNQLVHLALNPLLLWDIRKAVQIEDWKEKYGKELTLWIGNIGEFDAYVSMGIFTFNHPEYRFPSFTENYFEMQGKQLGHPLMDREACVRNDLQIERAPTFLIITGANMAGKSTYLRTIGVNYLLACMGAPVFAGSLTICPVALVTSLRTSDSLSDNESYFFAELKRLKMIIDRLESGEKLFILLDEILKGTNSIDKQKGSLALIRQFIRFRCCGIIATHDLLLGDLAKEFPENIRNYRFEADIEEDNLHFSYLLRPGVARNMNATFLMRKMGITL